MEDLGGIWESLSRVEPIKLKLNALSANFTILDTLDASNM